jgi:uncharacterized protein YciI
VHCLLIYEVDAEFVQRRAQSRSEHSLAWHAADTGDLVLAGALARTHGSSLLLFSGQTPDAATRFAAADPYVRNGLVKSWRVVQWNTVVGHDASIPLRPG